MKLSIIDKDILITLYKKGYSNQRNLMKDSGYSLGSVNKSLGILSNAGFLDSKMMITQKAIKFIKDLSPKNAIILAAGYGMRMVPINTETPKGLLTVDGEPLVERTIKHLHDIGITDISIVVGFMMESYDYLVDKYDVKMIYNNEYAFKNNLHSLSLAAERIDRTYIVPCDIWSESNPFSAQECYSWYMVSDLADSDSWIRVNRKAELVRLENDKDSGSRMIGVSYVCGNEAEKLREKLLDMSQKTMYHDSFWEEAAFEGNKMFLNAKVVKEGTVTEINTFEQLRALDSDSKNLANEAMDVAASTLGAEISDIKNITVLKKGMTNRSFLFFCRDSKYIMRIPGEGTDNLIDRKKEAAVYKALEGKGICDDNVYMNPENGFKITRFIEGARNCDPKNQKDLEICMKKLRDFHDMKLSVPHTFDIFERAEYYKSLWGTDKSVYCDYEDTRAKVISLKDYIQKQKIEMTLAHIDAVPDNFMIIEGEKGKEPRVLLIDWEYAGMQDKYVDLAMFAIYALYDRAEIDNLIDTYFAVGGEKADEDIRTRIYAYVSICGFLWSNWCEYKRGLGVDFGDYSLRQYRYAKDFYKLVQERINE
ncbi:MAG: NTP transferase domain-containing protein [Eubacterium sp.]|nr:NTP transferase domain-containing protein [Eubacterium sp.]